ncbi:ferrichrome ABC transporter permease, partial [Bacillus velezensis]
MGLLKKKQTMTALGASGSEIQWTARSFKGAVLLCAGIAVLLIGAALSVSIGAADIHLRTVWDA